MERGPPFRSAPRPSKSIIPTTHFRTGGRFRYGAEPSARRAEPGRLGTPRLSRKTARTPELTSWSGWAAAGYYRDLPGGFSVYVEPSYGASRYDAADPFFGERRKDRLLELQVAVLNRSIVFERFTPRLALTFARRNSTIDIYDFNQRRLEVGITSSF